MASSNISEYIKKGNYASAAVELGSVIEEKAEDWKSWSLLGMCFLELGDYPQAETSLTVARGLNPDSQSILLSLADCYYKTLNFTCLFEVIDEILLKAPSNPDALVVKAQALLDIGKHSDGLEVARMMPKSDFRRSLIEARVLTAVGDLPKAKAVLDSLGQLENAEFFYAWARINISEGILGEAKTALRNTVRLKPSHAIAWHDLGTIELHEFNYKQARENFLKSIKINPRLKQAHHNLGIVYQMDGRLSAAAASFKRAFEIDSNYAHSKAQYANLLTHMGAWDDPFLQDVKTEVLHGQPPFSFLSFEDNPAQQLERSLKYYEGSISPKFKSLKRPLSSWRMKDGDRKLRVGFFSADIRRHATAILIRGLFRDLDKSCLELFVYSYGPDVMDEYRADLEARADRFYACHDLEDIELIELAREDELDIAIDLKGYTQDTRSQIFAARLAPVQINYLGYPGSLGMPEMDFIIADETVIPSSHEQYYTERVLRMPRCYQPNDCGRTPVKRKLSREKFGLNDEYFVFCSFNANYKITQVEVQVWSEILLNCENSVLWLLAGNKWAKANLIRRFAKAGVTENRLIFAPKLPIERHIERLSLADLFLDSFCVNAHTTASDCVWAGVPVLTMKGEQFAARVAASINVTIGHDELVAQTRDHYIEIANKFYNERDFAKKHRLSPELIKSSPLFDSREYAEDFIGLLKQAYAIQKKSAGCES